MRHLILILSTVVATQCLAQPLNRHESGASATKGSEVDGPCAGEQKNVGECWNCFRSLIGDCSKAPGDDDAKKACLQGANDYFVWCLGHIGSKAGASNSQTPEMQSWAPGSDLLRQFVMPDGADTVQAWVQTRDSVHVYSDPVIEHQVDGTWIAVLPWPADIDLVGSSPTIVMRWTGGSTDEALADVLTVTSDLNGDGSIDHSDKIAAVVAASDGRLGIRDLVSILSR